MSPINLQEKDVLAVGGERTCYIHPDDKTKIIKIIHTDGEHNQQNELEKIYMNYLENRKVDLSQLATYYGEIETNLGNGLIYERILDYNSDESKSIRYYLVNRLITEETQLELLNQLKTYLQKNAILFVDTSLTNVFCKKINEDKYKLIIVDGLGAKRVGFKFWLYRHCKLYTKYKIKRQWSKFFTMYQKDIKRLKLGVQPFTRL